MSLSAVIDVFCTCASTTVPIFVVASAPAPASPAPMPTASATDPENDSVRTRSFTEASIIRSWIPEREELLT